MNIEVLLQKLEGIQTINSVASILSVSKAKAIYYIYRLRKQGYVKTTTVSSKKKVYYISFEHTLGGTSYTDILNENSPLKLATSTTYRIYGKTPSLEETLIYAIKTKKLRTVLASLALFKKINNWTELYRLAKANHVEREVGALYDLARKIMKTRKMPKRFRNNILPQENSAFEFIIKGLRSKEFGEIESTWKIYLPFNKQDLEDYT